MGTEKGRVMTKPSVQFCHLIRIWLLAACLPAFCGCMSIHKAADRGNLTVVKQFLQKGVAVDVRDRYGRTPLMYTLTKLDNVQYLVEKGADVNARDNEGETPLMKAAFLGQLDVVEYLAAQGADVNVRNEQGETPLMQATRNLDVVKFLVEHGADVNARNNQGETLLLKAAVSGRLSIVQYLLKSGAVVDAAAETDRAR